MIALGVPQQALDSIDPAEGREIRMECLRMAVALEADADDALDAAKSFCDFVIHGERRAEPADVH